MPNKGKTEEIIYEWICKNPGLCTYDISKKLNMTGGRVRHALTILNKKGLVKFRFIRNNPRIKKLTFPIKYLDLLPKNIKVQLKFLIKNKQ